MNIKWYKFNKSTGCKEYYLNDEMIFHTVPGTWTDSDDKFFAIQDAVFLYEPVAELVISLGDSELSAESLNDAYLIGFEHGYREGEVDMAESKS